MSQFSTDREAVHRLAQHGVHQPAPSRTGQSGVVPVQDHSYHVFLQSYGSLVSFDGCLRCFGFSPLTLPSVIDWNQAPWRQEYGELARRELFFFADDILGNQFAFSPKGIVRFDVETAHTEKVAGTFSEFASLAMGWVDEISNRWILNLWTANAGTLPTPNQHLVPTIPFVAGGEFVADNLYLIERNESMTARGQFARQIKDLPDGSQIRLATKQ